MFKKLTFYFSVLLFLCNSNASEIETLRPWYQANYMDLSQVINTTNDPKKSSLTLFLESSENLYQCAEDSKIGNLKDYRNAIIAQLSLYLEENNVRPNANLSKKSMTLKLIEEHITSTTKNYLKFLYQYKPNKFAELIEQKNIENEIVKHLCPDSEAENCSLFKILMKAQIKSSLNSLIQYEQYQDLNLIKQKINTQITKLNNILKEFDVIYSQALMTGQDKKAYLKEKWEEQYSTYITEYSKLLLDKHTLISGTKSLQSDNKIGTPRRKDIGFFRKVFLKDTHDLKVQRDKYFTGLTHIKYKLHNYIDITDIEGAINELDDSYQVSVLESVTTHSQLQMKIAQAERKMSGHQGRQATNSLNKMVTKIIASQILTNPQNLARTLAKNPNFATEICKGFDYKLSLIKKDRNHILKTALFGGLSLVGTITAGVLVAISAPVTLTATIAISSVSLSLGVSIIDAPVLRKNSKRYQKEMNEVRQSLYLESTTEALADNYRQLELQFKEAQLYSQIAFGTTILDLIGFGHVIKSTKYGTKLTKLIKESSAQNKLTKEINFTIATLTKKPQAQLMFQQMTKQFGQKAITEFTIYMSQTPKSFQKLLAKNMGLYQSRDSFSTIFTRTLDESFINNTKLDVDLAYEFRNFLSESKIATDIPVERIDIVTDFAQYIRTIDYASEAKSLTERSLRLDIISAHRAILIDQIIPEGTSRLDFLTELKNRPQLMDEIERKSISNYKSSSASTCKL